MAFVPQQTANLAYLISAAAAILLLGVALRVMLPWPARVRRRRVGVAPAATASPSMTAAPALAASEEPGPRRWPLHVAITWAAAVGGLSGVVFSIRFGAIAAVATLLLIVLGIGRRRLIAIASICIALIPLVYLTQAAHNYGGYSFDFAQHELLAHWMAAGAVCALIAAAGLQIVELRARRREAPIALSSRNETSVASGSPRTIRAGG
jgi:hypothetical protein